MISLRKRFLYGLSGALPGVYKRQLREVLQFSGVTDPFERWGGIAAVLTLCGCLFFLILGFVIPAPFSYVSFVAFGLFLIIGPYSIYTYFYFKASNRVEEVNKVLPNALSMIAANMSSGVTPFQAVKMAALPEFGVLGELFERATSKAQGTESFTTYLKEMTQFVNSEPLERSVRLFSTSLKSGGKVVNLLRDLAKDISDRDKLKGELMTNMRTNLMFIVFIIVVGTPMLLSISIYFVDEVGEIQGGLDLSSPALEGTSLGGGELAIDGEFLRYVSFALLFITGLLAGMFLGGVLEGNLTYGFRFSPFIIIASLVLFAVAQFLVNNYLGK
ncbi:MAG: Flp pilus assembly protein TadB [Candidatus Woesearchaeota archaeon]|jgi:Flp pilus assembly protein TadB